MDCSSRVQQKTNIVNMFGFTVKSWYVVKKNLDKEPILHKISNYRGNV